MADETTFAYDFRGDLMECCSCNAPCPCSVGHHPDGGECFNCTAYHVRTGTIGDVDVSGLNVVSLVHYPGNALDGGWRQVTFIDSKATEEQFEALRDAFQGQLGGPLADLASLVEDWVAVYTAPIEYTSSDDGHGAVRVGRSAEGEGHAIDAEMEPFRGPDGEPTVLFNTVWSAIPGYETILGTAKHNSASLPEHGMEWSFEGRNATQSVNFRMKQEVAARAEARAARQ